MPPGGAPVPPEREDYVRPRPRAPCSLTLSGPTRTASVAVLRHHPHSACSIIETSRDDALSRARLDGI
jgi:hypothetical protein